jgi:hypothetical protein
VDAVKGVIQAGIDAGDFRALHARLAALTVLSNDEATQNWLRVDGGPVARDAIGSRLGLGGPHAIGTVLADLVLRGLLGDPSMLDAVRAEADALDASAVLDP